MNEALMEAITVASIISVLVLTVASIISVLVLVIALVLFTNRGDLAKVQSREVKTQRLLNDMLSLDQRQELAHRGRVSVTGSAGGRYRVHRFGFVVRIDDESPRREIYCFVPEDHAHLSYGDILLARVVALQTDEPAALAVATKLSWGMA